MVNELAAPGEVIPLAQTWAERVLALPDHLVAMTKPLLRKCADLSWEPTITMEEFAEPMCFTAKAHQDAVDRFLSEAGKSD